MSIYQYMYNDNDGILAKKNGKIWTFQEENVTVWKRDKKSDETGKLQFRTEFLRNVSYNFFMGIAVPQPSVSLSLPVSISKRYNLSIIP